MRQPTRGERNNNPGNIRRTKDHWLGLRLVQTDADFFQFETSVYGIRAVMVLLKHYAGGKPITVREIISRWAPSNENNTASYIDDICNRCLVMPDREIELEYNFMKYYIITSAIITHENGANVYNHAVFVDAFDAMERV